MHASAPDDIRYDVFISYAREDGRAYAERLAYSRRRRGLARTTRFVGADQCVRPVRLRRTKNVEDH